MAKKHVPGRNAGKVMLYALSTCVWCNKTKKLLNELGVEYDYTDVDLLGGWRRRRLWRRLRNTTRPVLSPPW